MKTVYVCRHGVPEFDYAKGGEGRLSPQGTEDVTKVAISALLALRGRHVEIISSPTLRAQESARVFAQVFDTNYTLDKVLCGGYHDRSSGLENTIRCVADAAIIVTHRTNIEDFTRARYGVEVSLGEGKYVLVNQTSVGSPSLRVLRSA